MQKTTRRIAVKTVVFAVVLLAALSFGFIVQAQNTPAYAATGISNTQDFDNTTITPTDVEIIEQPTYEATGMASWYGGGFHGGKTACGEKYDMNAFTAAHKTLPFGTILRVTNLENGKNVLVRVTDRGPFLKNRIIDLSSAAAKEINLGVGEVKIEAFLPFEESETESFNEPDYLIAFSPDLSPVTIKTELTVIQETDNFTQAMKMWKKLRDKGQEVYFTIHKIDQNTGKKANSTETANSSYFYQLSVLHNAETADLATVTP